MPNLPVSSDVDTFMSAANSAAMRTAMGLGTADSPTFSALTVSGIITASSGISAANDINLSASKRIGFGNGTYLLSMATGSLFQLSGTTPQAFLLSNTYTDASNFERGFMRWNTNVLQIGAEALGTGVNRQLDFVAGGATRLTISSNGNVNMGGTFTALANVTTGGSSYFTWSSRSAMGSGANGNIALYNASVNDFGLLQFGGTVNTFPALKRNATDLQVKLADDSGFGGIEAGSMVTAYNIFTDAANYERAFIRYASNVLRIGHEAAGTGTTRGIVLRTGNVDCLTVNTNGTINVFTSLSAGANLFAGPNSYLGHTGRSRIYSDAADGSTLRMTNNAGSDFGLLQWGGATNLFPALKRNSAALQARLADDSAFTNLEASDYRTYNLNTDASNYERSFMRWNGSNTLEIGTEYLGTGVNRGLNLVVNGVARLLIATSGVVSTQGSLAAGGTLSTVAAGQIAWSGRSRFTAPVDGNITMNNGSMNDFNLLQWGGTTSAFPALKRNTTDLQAKLADDSAFTSLDALAFRSYNLFTDAANYERGVFGYTSNVLKIGTENAGTGVARQLEFVVGGTTRLTISTAGTVTAATGLVSSGNVTAGNTSAILWTGRAKFKSSADGLITLFNAAETDFSRLMFGGTTSAFPSIKRSGTDLHARLSDDSAFTSISALSFTATSTITGVGYVNGAASRYTWQGNSAMRAPSDGVIRLENQASTSFTCLEFGFASQGIFQGAGSPEGVVTALVGSIYMRTDGGANTSHYIKESGTGNTGWVAK